MGIFENRKQYSSAKHRKTYEELMPMEDPCAVIGSKGLIRKDEFVRVIIQSLYSLGYSKSASSLEVESGVSYKSSDFEKLESQALKANWDDCLSIIKSINGLTDETRHSALFLVFKQFLLECLNCGDDSQALAVLRKRVGELDLGIDKVQRLADSILTLETMDKTFLPDLRKRLLIELERLLPPPITVPEGRLEHLIEMAVASQLESCLFHNSSDPVSLYEDHFCDKSQIPTETIQVLTAHKNEVWFVQFSNNGEYLASSSSDCTAIIWKVLDGGELTLKHVLESHQKPVSFLAWSPDDAKLLTCGNGEVLKLWDVVTGTCRHTFGDHAFVVSSCAWFPDSRRFVSGSSDPESGIRMWDCDGNELKVWRGIRMPKIVDLAVTPDGENLISIFSEKEIRILNLSMTGERRISEEHPITSLSVSGDSKFLLVNLNSQEIHMWDISGKGEKPSRYTGHIQHKFVIRSCFGGLNSTFIASGSEDSQVYIWNRREKPKPIEVLYGHSKTVNCVSWNPRRSQMLASASDDQTIRIWGPRTSSKAQ